MDLRFDGRVGEIPEPETLEFMVLAACADRKAWPLMNLKVGDFERAIAALQRMGWGFQWITLH